MVVKVTAELSTDLPLVLLKHPSTPVKYMQVSKEGVTHCQALAYYLCIIPQTTIICIVKMALRDVLHLLDGGARGYGGLVLVFITVVNWAGLLVFVLCS